MDFAALPRLAGVATLKGGGDCMIVGGHFAFDGPAAGLLVNRLSPIVHIQEEHAVEWLGD